MGQHRLQPIQPTKVSVTFDTVLNFDGDIDELGDSEITCKQTFISTSKLTWFVEYGKCIVHNIQVQFSITNRSIV